MLMYSWYFLMAQHWGYDAAQASDYVMIEYFTISNHDVTVWLD